MEDGERRVGVQQLPACWQQAGEGLHTATARAALLRLSALTYRLAHIMHDDNCARCNNNLSQQRVSNARLGTTRRDPPLHNRSESRSSRRASRPMADYSTRLI